jgi:hypothetical protein
MRHVNSYAAVLFSGLLALFINDVADECEGVPGYHRARDLSLHYPMHRVATGKV